MDEDKATSGSGLVSRKKTRGPTVCKKLKKRIANQKLEKIEKKNRKPEIGVYY